MVARLAAAALLAVLVTFAQGTSARPFVSQEVCARWARVQVGGASRSDDVGWRATVAGCHGSDHHAVVYTNPHGGRGISWNMQVGRPPGQVRAGLDQLLRHYQPQWVALQECNGYVAVLTATSGYRLVVGPAGRDQQTCVLVSSHVGAGPGYARQMTDTGWPYDHWQPRGITTILIAGRLRIVSVHLPADHGPGRIRQRRVEIGRLARFIRRHTHATLLLVGDWNGSASSLQKELAPVVVRVVAATRPTQARLGQPMDYALLRPAES